MKASRLAVMCIAACSGLCTLHPTIARAQVPPPPVTCTFPRVAFLGERAQGGVAAGGALYYRTNVSVGRSYAVFAWAPDWAGGLSLALELFTDPCATPVPEVVYVTPFEPALTEGVHATFLSNRYGPIYIRVRHTHPTTLGVSVSMLVIETTLFSPWWFTGGTNQAFIEVRNNMDSGTAAQVTLYRANGTVCGTTDLLYIAGNGNAAIAVNTIGNCAAAVSGSAAIAFYGNPGGIAANITTIDPVNGTSFDAPFTPRMAWSMFSQ